MHNWSRVGAWIYHDFHTSFLVAIKRGLTALLPSGYYAMAEQSLRTMGPGILTLQARNGTRDFETTGGTAVAAMPEIQISDRVGLGVGFQQKRLAIRHVSDDRVVAILELVSPGNKSSRKEFARFVRKSCAALESGVHVVVLDPFAAPRWNPGGIHGAIWERLGGTEYQQPTGKPLTYSSYESDHGAIPETHCFVQPGRVGEPLPKLPLFLAPGKFIAVDFEPLYCDAIRDVLPMHIEMVEGG